MTARDRIVLVVLVLAGLFAGGWFLVFAPKREQASRLSEQIDSQRGARDAALADVAAGSAARATYARDYATVARLGAAVPQDDNLASLLVQVRDAADATGVDFREVRTGQQSGAAAPAPAGPAAASQTVTATLPPGALVGAAGFPTMPFGFTFEGNFPRLSDFVGRLERFLVVNDRTLTVRGRFMTIDGIGLVAAAGGFPHVRASVAATTYLLPADQGLTAGATAQSPVGAAADGPDGDPTASTTPSDGATVAAQRGGTSAQTAASSAGAAASSAPSHAPRVPTAAAATPVVR
jgi:hypothetical protein